MSTKRIVLGRALQILGEETAVVERATNGGIVCDHAKGCLGVTMMSIVLVCTHTAPARAGPLQCSGKGALLRITGEMLDHLSH